MDDEPVLSTVKVASDPAQVVVNHVSFRVQLAAPVPRNSTVDSARLRAARAAVPGPGAAGAAGGAVAGGTAARPARRRAPVVWSGRTGPGDTGAHRLLQSVRSPVSGLVPSATEPWPGYAEPGYAEPGYAAEQESAAAATQTLARVEETTPLVVGPRGPRPPEHTQPLLSGMRPAHGAHDGSGSRGSGDRTAGSAGPRGPRGTRRRNEPVRHAYYPGRRMNLGVVLLPLRIFLGFISVYAGMGKLCDPVYFDGGRRGSMVTWLRSLEPWTIAAPLHDFAVTHPVGSGLTVAFLQVIVGVLTMCGLWQRLAASVGVLLSVALLLTVSWRTVPVYDAPDIIYLAAWSPLVIAGAPVYSMDGRLAGEAWRKLGPRVDIWELRRRVLRRGTLLATVVAGLALLVGALLGGAVRSSQTVTVPEPGEPPTNHLPGSPLPGAPDDRAARAPQTPDATAPDASRSPSPSASGTPSGRSGETGAPSRRETVQAPQQSAPPAEPPAATSSAGATGTPGGTSTQGTGGSTSGGDTGGSTSGGGTEGGNSGGGALGGLLG